MCVCVCVCVCVWERERERVVCIPVRPALPSSPCRVQKRIWRRLVFFKKQIEISVCVSYRGTIYWLLRISEPHGYKQLFAAVESATVVGVEHDLTHKVCVCVCVCEREREREREWVEHDLTHKVSNVSALREYTSSTSVLRKVSNFSALVYLLYEGTI